jgi:hypothetical protein
MVPLHQRAVGLLDIASIRAFRGSSTTRLLLTKHYSAAQLRHSTLLKFCKSVACKNARFLHFANPSLTRRRAPRRMARIPQKSGRPKKIK